MTKQEILNNESLFQRACSAYVARYVSSCVSSMFYDMGQRADLTAQIFEIDEEEIYGWYCRDDWEEPVVDLINDADLDTLEEIADATSTWWSDIVSACPEPVERVEDYGDGESETFYIHEGLGVREEDEDDAKRAIQEAMIDELRAKVEAAVREDCAWQEIAESNRLEPSTTEVYEHWAVDNWFGHQLAKRGEIIFDFCGMTIWGRTTSGQAMCLDHVIRWMVRDLEDDHWLWGEIA